MRIGIALGLVFTGLGIALFLNRNRLYCTFVGMHDLERIALGKLVRGYRCRHCKRGFESMEAAGAFGKVGA